MSGKTSFKWHGERIKQLKEEAIAEALWKAAQYAIAEAEPNIPLETGTLRRSGIATFKELPDANAVYERAKTGKPAEGEKRRQKGRFGALVNLFVSYNTPYAARLHENLEWKPRAFKRLRGRIIPKPAVGGPKWLEAAVPKAKARIVSFLREEMKRRGF